MSGVRAFVSPRLFGPASFYIAPGIGCICGYFVGGRWADLTVKKWIAKQGRRAREDRLKSCLVLMMSSFRLECVYGGIVEKAVGVVLVPLLAMFSHGVAQLFCFLSFGHRLPGRHAIQGSISRVCCWRYIVRYFFAAAGSTAIFSAIEKIGVDWFSTIKCGFPIFSAGVVL
ncbi:hypothetical protein GJ744_004240 [Endocarpon pusillum]|uniref:Uncharacterized protein n=1 Tax=Endocarpon pusillum TaxID=364733 RepID=A0A8H7DZA2_9EURO|nr:hypothetical protein GJ744_004240 [Endocarpon pusillum]